MGCGPSAPDSDLDREVAADLASSRQKMMDTKKLLLLGAGGSGKSTFFKQLQRVYGAGFDNQERMNFRSKIYEQILSQMQLLVTKCRQLGGDDHVTVPENPVSVDYCDYKENDSYADMIIYPDSTQSADFIKSLPVTTELSVEIAEHIKVLWRDPGIQGAWARRAKLCVVDSSKYFFEDVDRIAEANYIPSDEDLLYNRYMTTGMTEKSFSMSDANFVIVDVGGQRSERRKWIHFFDGVTAVLFVASLSCFDEVLFEDATKNVMHESLDVFDQTWNSPWFQEVAVILFLNKSDVFAEKLEYTDITQAFPEFTGGNDIDSSLQYIQAIFESRCENDESRNIYTHVTCATDSRNVERVFNDVQHIIINASLQNSGIL